MRAIVTPDDLKIGELIEPGFHIMELCEYSEKAAKSDPTSVNCIFKFKVVDGAYKGYSCNALFSEKALGMGKKLWAALGIPYDPVKGYELSTETFQRIAMNRPQLKVYVKRGKSQQGNEFNEPAEFEALS